MRTMAEHEAQQTLEVDDRYTLLLDGHDLVIRDKKGSKRKSSRVCGVSTGMLCLSAIRR
jgi:hypothetical protein